MNLVQRAEYFLRRLVSRCKFIKRTVNRLTRWWFSYALGKYEARPMRFADICADGIAERGLGLPARIYSRSVGT